MTSTQNVMSSTQLSLMLIVHGAYSNTLQPQRFLSSTLLLINNFIS